MFNLFKLDFVIEKALDQAAVELNEALRYRQKQFARPKAFFIASQTDQGPRIALYCPEQAQTLVSLSVQELLQQPETQAQLQKIPAMVQKLINWPKVIQRIEQRIEALGTETELHIQPGPKQAQLFRYHRPTGQQTPTTLLQTFIR
jgi:hypothetical protein